MSSTDPLRLPEEPTLFGADPTPALVGMINDAGTADQLEKVQLLFRESSAGAVRTESVNFEAILWLANKELLQGLDTARRTVPHQVDRLDGPGPFSWLVRCPNMAQLKKVSAHVAKTGGVAAGHPESPQVYLSDPLQQYLLSSGRCYFRGMAFEEVRRLQLYVPGADRGGGGGGGNGDNDEPIARICLSDSTGRQSELHGSSEKDLLEEFLAVVRDWDPDVIEGHELFKSHLAQIYQRCRSLDIPFLLGRFEHKASYRKSRMSIAERNLDYLRWMVPGREVVDTWIIAQLHDVTAREFVSTDLEDVAEALHLGSASPNQWIRQISRQLGYAYHLQAQIFPYPYEQVVLRGNATRINSLFLREYLRCRASLPARNEAREFTGGLTGSDYNGVARDVFHCDVQSLYPSLILHHRLEPSGDHLHLFLRLLEKLREFRLKAKAESQDPAQDERGRAFYQGLQATFKILINSFYGYLGFTQGQFSDFVVASEVTAKGRQLLQFQIDWLKQRGARVLEVDTDGIYFLSPKGAALIEELDAELPSGLRVELEGRYPAMFCHKMKNYALLAQNGDLIIRGSGLRSRSLEPYLRDALEELIGLALRGQLELLGDPLARIRVDISHGQLPITRLARTEVLSEPLWLYQKKTAGEARNRSAAYEIALQSGRRLVPGDAVSYYITGTKASVTAYQNAKPVEAYDPINPDENRAYYLKKLEDLEKKFLPCLLVETPS